MRAGRHGRAAPRRRDVPPVRGQRRRRHPPDALLDQLRRQRLHVPGRHLGGRRHGRARALDPARRRLRLGHDDVGRHVGPHRPLRLLAEPLRRDGHGGQPDRDEPLHDRPQADRVQPRLRLGPRRHPRRRRRALPRRRQPRPGPPLRHHLARLRPPRPRRQRQPGLDGLGHRRHGGLHRPAGRASRSRRPRAATARLDLAGPNPFTASTALALRVDRTQTVRVEVLDLLGRSVAVLHDGPVASGAALVRCASRRRACRRASTSSAPRVRRSR